MKDEGVRPCSGHEAFILHPSCFILWFLLLDVDVALNSRDFTPALRRGGGIFPSRVTQTLTEPCGPLVPLFHVAAYETVLAAGFGHVPAAGAETCRAAAFGLTGAAAEWRAPPAGWYGRGSPPPPPKNIRYFAY